MAAGGRWPHPLLVHLALFTVQTANGMGTVVANFGVHGINPSLFALLRDLVATPMLLGISLLIGGRRLPAVEDLKWVALAGFCLCQGQVGIVIGVKLVGPSCGSIWCSTAPIFCTLFTALLGHERLSVRKAAGILLAVAGAIFMVADDAGPGASGGGIAQLCGHAVLCFGAMCNAGFIINAKRLVARYPSSCVTAWGYCMATLVSMLYAGLVRLIPSLLRLLCSDADKDLESYCMEHAWKTPASMLWALAYWVFIVSVFGYLLLCWASQYTKASIASAYMAVQPLAADALVSLLLLARGREWIGAHSIRPPGLQDLGGTGVILGLFLVLHADRLDSEARVDMPATPLTEEPKAREPAGRCGGGGV